jgi:hypothetical protein
MWAAATLDDLQNVKSRHYEGNLLQDKFWNGVYTSLYRKKYESLSAVAKIAG